MRKLLAVLLAVLLFGWQPIGVFAQSGGNCSTFRSWNTGDSLTAGDLNSSFTTVGVTNVTLDCVDSYSDSVANMQSATNPYASDSESLATNARGEIERLRYILQDVFGWANWYRRDTSVDFAQGTGIDGVGQGRHVTAVGFHAWSGSLRWPSITSVAAHTSGIFWPFAHHLAVGIDGTSNEARWGLPSNTVQQNNARTWYVFHAEAFTMHHTAALRFSSSEGPMGNGQRGHVTALRLQVGGGFADDAVILGHKGSRLWIESAHITGGTNQVLAVAASGLVSTTAVSATGTWASRGQFSGAGRAAQAGWKFTLEAHAITFINATSHATSQVMYPAAVTIDLTQSGPVADGRDRATALSANSWAHLYWIYDGTTVSGIISPDAPVIRGTPVGGGPNLTGLAYTSWAYAGTVRLGALGDGVNPDIVPVHILGAMAYYHMGARVLSGGTSTTEATVDLATVVPPTATDSLLNVMARLGVTIRYSNASAGGSRDFLTMRSGAAAVDYRNSTQALVPNVSQRVYYIVILAGGTVQVDLDVLGYKLPVGG